MLWLRLGCLSLTLVAACDGANGNPRSDIVRVCLTPRLVISSTTPTIQSIHTIGDDAKLAERLMIGRIEKYEFDGRVLVGYLSTKYYDDDDLRGLAGDNDREGYFVVDTDSFKVAAGLSHNALQTVLATSYDIKREPTLKPLESESQGLCVSE